MHRKAKRGKSQYTKPDHRLMIPELRSAEDPLDLEVRKLRLRQDELNPDQSKIWR